MFEPEPRLRHLPFFEAVASSEEGTTDWHAHSAGLVTLRLVDAWLEHGVNRRDEEWSVRSVRCAIEAMDDGTPIKAILGRVVDALEEQRPDIHVVITPMMAYGRSLEYEARWFLASDVYRSVLAHLHPTEDHDASVAANLRLGQCYRNLNQSDDATNAFESALEIATSVGDMVGILRARIGEAQIAVQRGNLPRAAKILDDTISRAATADMSDVRSRALHDRSGVATLTGQYEIAIRLAYDALEISESPTERDRILSDIAAAFLQLGVYSAAHDAYLVLSATAQEQFIRWASAINLVEIAARLPAQTQFEQYRRALVGIDLPPFLAAGFELNLGLGYRQFGNPTRACFHLKRAIGIAEEHDLNQIIFAAEELLEEVETPAPPAPSSAIALETEEVAQAIRNLRVTAGVG